MGTQTTLVWLSREGVRMTSHPLTLQEHSLLQRSAACPRRNTFETAAGSLILHSFCPPSLVTSLKADRGLHAFTHVPEREHQLLLGIAERPDCALTLAYTTTGEIVGQVTLAPADAWWQGVANTYELAMEVSSPWRRLGIARQLLSLTLEHHAVEEMILVAVGLARHRERDPPDAARTGHWPDRLWGALARSSQRSLVKGTVPDSRRLPQLQSSFPGRESRT